MRRRKMKKHIVTAVIALLIIGAVFSAVYILKLDNTNKLILTSSANGRTLKIYMVGDPSEPYGETNCRLDIYSGSKKIEEQALAIQNKGNAVTATNFLVDWQDDYVSIRISGADQADEELKIAY